MGSIICSLSRKGQRACVFHVNDEVRFEIGNNQKYNKKREALEFLVRQRLLPLLCDSGACHPYFQDLAENDMDHLSHISRP